jgi:hypothetical protein
LVGTCSACQALIDAPDASQSTCPACGSSDYRHLNLAEPAGFRTDFRVGQDFSGVFDWSPRASRARMAADVPTDAWQVVQGSRICALPSTGGTVFTINDNNGRLFQFRKYMEESWVVPEAFPNPNAQPDLRNAQVDVRALASIAKTDVLLVGLNSAHYGFDLAPTRAAARAAWYSFVYLLRSAAAIHLDVDRNELRAGLRTTRTSTDGPEGEVFIFDSLENGAGYSTFLGRPSEYSALLQRILEDFRPNWERHLQGGRICDSACYDCLKDYANMAYHGLLDWRLAIDMAELAGGQPINLARWFDRAEQDRNQFCEDFGWEPVQFGVLPCAVYRPAAKALITAHPLWSTKLARLGDTLAEAVVDAASQGFADPAIHTLFDLARRPAWVEAQIWTGAVA